MTRIAANTGFLWTERPFLDRIRLASAAGFSAVEFHDEAQDCDPAALADALAGAGLPVLSLNTRMGSTTGLAALPGREAEARAAIDAAAATALRIGAGAIHVTAGRMAPDADPDACRIAYCANLVHALDAFGGTVLIEPISRAAVPGYYLNSLYQAADIADTLDNGRLKLMFDVHHIRALGYDLVEVAREFMPFIGHVQLSGWPARDEPVLAHSMIGMLQALGYAGDFGAEYKPSGPVEDGLGWLKDIRHG